jgi:N-methylhydantoinase A
MGAWMVGIDTGGTFTDLIAFETETGELRTAKVPSDPGDPSAAVMCALDEIFADGLTAGEVAFLAHGTTVATNALLEGKGARTGLLITQGFRAVYEARGWSEPDPDDLLDPFYQKPPLLAPQRLTEEVAERLDHQGTVVEALDEATVRAAVDRLRGRNIDSLAVCFLFSFVNPEHEERAAAIVRDAAPEWRLSLSSRVLPTIREYPRLSTTVIDAYVGPVMERYLSSLDARLREAGIATPQVFVMQSNGGLMRINMGARFPNQTLLSGPAAGVVSGLDLARLGGRADLVTFDMGGTSTDIGLIAGGRVEETSAGRIAGQDIGTPMLAVTTLGAGGGTIARIGPDGLLKVGPDSAGADPGPACYGRGGDRPTVTDANLLLGALGADSALGGRMRMDPALAATAVERTLAQPLGLTVTAAAAGILTIVNTTMAVDLRLTFQRRGEDPRRFALVAFGGAGPLHAALLAREIGIPTVLVPTHPGLGSAMGLLQTSVRHVYVRSAVGRLSEFPMAAMNGHFQALRDQALADVAEEGFEEGAVHFTRQLDMRYPHQGYQIAVEVPDGAVSDGDRPALKRLFDDAHQRIYGANAPDEDAEIVTFRLIAEIAVPRLEPPTIADGDGDVGRAVKGERDLYDLASGAFLPAGVYDRSRLLAGDRIAGPAIVEQFDSTTVVLAGQSVEVDRRGNLLIDTGLSA